MDKQGYGSKKEIKEIAETIWTELIGMSSYAFPKSHASSYALLTNATQFLKVNYPLEFFCSHLQWATDDEYMSIREVSRNKYGVRYYLPEINLSKEKFIIHNNRIVWSLTSIKGLGTKASQEIISKQPFNSFEDFFNRINKRVVNVRVVRLMIIANLFKKFGKRNKISKQYAKLRKDKEFEKISNMEWKLKSSEIMPYISKSVREMFSNKTSLAITHSEFLEKDFDKRIVIAGIVESYKEIMSKRGMMCIIKINDSGDTFNVVCWSDYFNKMEEKGIDIKEGLPVRISGYKSLSNRDEEQITLGREKGSYIKILK
ncbi:MAG: hypothetical protein V1663_02535 [archaeon]